MSHTRYLIIRCSTSHQMMDDHEVLNIIYQMMDDHQVLNITHQATTRCRHHKQKHKTITTNSSRKTAWIQVDVSHPLDDLCIKLSKLWGIESPLSNPPPPKNYFRCRGVASQGSTSSPCDTTCSWVREAGIGDSDDPTQLMACTYSPKVDPSERPYCGGGMQYRCNTDGHAEYSSIRTVQNWAQWEVTAASMVTARAG